MSYQEDEGAALAQLINFVIRVRWRCSWRETVRMLTSPIRSTPDEWL